jgi:hypothetical protein
MIGLTHLLRRAVTVVLLLSVVVLTSCSKPTETTARPEGPIMTVEAAGTVGIAGGTVTATIPGSAIEGLTITVPADAVPADTTFRVSSRPYDGPIPEGSTPLTPLIQIENGGAFADDFMTVTIPIELPEGNFAMGFIVDKSGKLEGMPLVDLSATSITVATRHFSDLLILTIPEADLPESVSTGFMPGRDDWEFPNTGSYLDPAGNCAGQTLTMAWYFYEKRLAPGPALYGRYDNNGGDPTPDWKDNSNGYRFASVVQEDVDWNGDLRNGFKTLYKDGNDVLTWKAFLYSIFITQEPQYVAVYRTGGGHALLVYGVDRTKGELLIADPNYPGDTKRRIRYVNGKFEPYKSGSSTKAIKAGNVRTYSSIVYFAKTACVPWAKITSRWAEFEAGTIGDGQFPPYELKISSDKDAEVVLGDRFETTAEKVKVVMTPSKTKPVYFNWYMDGKTGDLSDWIEIPLKMGSNKVGFYMTGKHKLSKGKLVGGEYVDFQWVDIVRVVEEEEPKEEEPEPEEQIIEGATITGVYYGQLKTNTRSEGWLLFIVDSEGLFALRNAPEILAEETDEWGKVVKTTFRFRKGWGQPPIGKGRWQICAGPNANTYYTKSEPFSTTGDKQNLTVNVGQPPPTGE